MGGHCRVGLQAVTDIYADPVKRKYVADLIADGCSPEQFVSRLTADLDMEARLMLRREFDELPKSFTRSVMNVWAEAELLGDSFDIEAVPLTLGESLEHARKGIVNWSVRHDNEGFHVTVSHVPGHHAESLKVPEAVAT